MAYGELPGTVGEPTTYTCANRQLADECAYLGRGRPHEPEIMRYRPSRPNTRIPE